MSDEQADFKKMIADALEKARKERESRAGSPADQQQDRPQQRQPGSQPGQRPGREQPDGGVRPVDSRRPQGVRPPVLPVLRDQAQTTDSGYRFLNPYNFVRWLEPPQQAGGTALDLLLDRCAPPPHDRYVGLSGRITCTVTAVTPLFISDSHETREDKTRPKPRGPEKEHRTYRFFEYAGRAALPASSLRGMIRSVFEAATNSCFAVFDPARRSYRYEATRAAALVPARVMANPKGGWQLQILPGFAPLTPGYRPKVLYAATVHLYDPIQGRPIRAPKVNLGRLRHGAKCYALVEKAGLFTYVHAVERNAAALPKPVGPKEEIVEGWLCINNQNIENKRKERLFFVGNGVPAPIVSLPKEVAQRYEDLIRDYQARHEDEVRDRQQSHHPVEQPKWKADPPDAGLSRYMYDKSDLELCEGTLVYASLNGPASSPRVDFIAPAAVPRVAYSRTAGELLPSYLHPCEDVEALCPACRTFGWVRGAHDEKQDLSESAITAYAGRVRFSHGTFTSDGDRGTLGGDEGITLAILGSPKSTTTRFYLLPDNRVPRDNMEDPEIGYDGHTVLRGRKVYRHHGVVRPAEYTRPSGGTGPIKDDQNRTVKGVRGPGNTWEFAIDFENLAQVELGALLWTLELEGAQHHRLGFAKPLGFGSVDVRITALELLEPEGRYRALTEAGWNEAPDQKTILLDTFRASITTHYDRPFLQLENVRDLLALLGEPPDLPIHYPRTDRAPAAEGKNFEWFMGNKRSGRDAGPRLALRLADKDTAGLPLLDRYGKNR